MARLKLNPVTGKLDLAGIENDVTSKPEGKSDGYFSVTYVDGEARAYFYINGSRWYLSAVEDPETEILDGSPIGLLLALTYTETAPAVTKKPIGLLLTLTH